MGLANDPMDRRAADRRKHDRRASGGPLILVVDDDESLRRLETVLLQRAGCRVIEARDGLEALAKAIDQTPDLILMDVQMPGADGVEVTRRLRARSQTAITPIILVTGLDQTHDKVAGLDAGATDFVTKPFEGAELLARVRAALRMKEAVDHLEDAQSVLVALANAIEAKDPATEHHCSRLAAHAVGMARLAGLTEDLIEAVGYGAVLHDIGKIGVSEALLRNQGPLTDAEWTEMRRHPAIGANIVAPLRLGRLVTPIVRGHHERWDGSGYPDGLSAGGIPVGARIIAIVDSYDAIVHGRPYREARTPEEARRELLRARGSQFDAELVGLFVDHHAELMAARHPGPTDHTRGLRLVAGAA
jgi:putative two-component system response regulator